MRSLTDAPDGQTDGYVPRGLCGPKTVKLFVSRIIFADVTVEYPPLQVVFIFFDTSTFDEIERDVKVP